MKLTEPIISYQHHLIHTPPSVSLPLLLVFKVIIPPNILDSDCIVCNMESIAMIWMISCPRCRYCIHGFYVDVLHCTFPNCENNFVLKWNKWMIQQQQTTILHSYFITAWASTHSTHNSTRNEMQQKSMCIKIKNAINLKWCKYDLTKLSMSKRCRQQQYHSLYPYFKRKTQDYIMVWSWSTGWRTCRIGQTNIHIIWVRERNSDDKNGSQYHNTY